MLFITNRTPNESAKTTATDLGRSISFDYQNTTASQSLYFCERQSKNNYVEIGSQPFFKSLKEITNQDTQLLLYIHGFNNNMEPDVFGNARKLQKLFDAKQKGLVLVVPLIWPCDDDPAYAFLDDYWDDQDAADASGCAFGRLMGKFNSWRHHPDQLEVPCTRKINVLAHSMGNRVLKNALKDWVEKYGNHGMPQIFHNVFMVAADVKNEILEEGKDGRHIVDASRNVVVYFANDDLAMSASKIANVKNKTLSRRMGMTGPKSLKETLNN